MNDWLYKRRQEWIHFSTVPFTERSRKMRGIIDVLLGCYPKFVFGGRLGEILPVFHFHETSTEELKPQLRYLYENGYETVVSEEIYRFVKKGRHPGKRRVALCFDDGWKSLWTTAYPLLKQYGFRAITYVIPSRILDGDISKTTAQDLNYDSRAIKNDNNPFVTWNELKIMYESGLVDVQFHTLTHSSIFCSNQIIGFVDPEYKNQSLLSRPLISENGKDRFIDPSELGSPIYSQRSRMSDGRRFYDDEFKRKKCIDYVKYSGGVEFFQKKNWQKELLSIVKFSGGYFEKAGGQKDAIFRELEKGLSIIRDKLHHNQLYHVCFPWGIAGKIAIESVKKLGIKTAFSDRLSGKRIVRAGDDPYRLMRLKNNYIYCLPGKGRRLIVSFKN
jgi:hypothetical protein